MYSVVLMAAMTATPDAAAFGKRHGCDGGCMGCYGGGCTGYAAGCSGGCYGGGGCHGGKGGLFGKHRGHGCSGGCHAPLMTFVSPLCPVQPGQADR